MITFLNIIILMASSFLTLSFLPHFKILGVVALLPLFFIAQLAYFRKGFEPLLLAALTGIFFDLFSPYPFGFYLVFFLMTAVLVRYFFDEGLRRLSFWHYLGVIFFALTYYYVAQIGLLYFGGKIPTIMVFKPIFYGYLINLIGSAIFYVLGSWYFEQLIVLEDRLKRR